MKKEKLDKNDAVLVSFLYIIVIILIVLLVLTIKNQKDTVKNNIDSFIEEKNG